MPVSPASAPAPASKPSTRFAASAETPACSAASMIAAQSRLPSSSVTTAAAPPSPDRATARRGFTPICSVPRSRQTGSSPALSAGLMASWWHRGLTFRQAPAAHEDLPAAHEDPGYAGCLNRDRKIALVSRRPPSPEDVRLCRSDQGPAHPGTLLANLGSAPLPRQCSLWIILWRRWGALGVLLGKSASKTCGFPRTPLSPGLPSWPDALHRLWRKEFRPGPGGPSALRAPRAL